MDLQYTRLNLYTMLTIIACALIKHMGLSLPTMALLALSVFLLAITSSFHGKKITLVESQAHKYWLKFHIITVVMLLVMSWILAWPFSALNIAILTGMLLIGLYQCKAFLPKSEKAKNNNNVSKYINQASITAFINGTLFIGIGCGIFWAGDALPMITRLLSVLTAGISIPSWMFHTAVGLVFLIPVMAWTPLYLDGASNNFSRLSHLGNRQTLLPTIITSDNIALEHRENEITRNTELTSREKRKRFDTIYNENDETAMNTQTASSASFTPAHINNFHLLKFCVFFSLGMYFLPSSSYLIILIFFDTLVDAKIQQAQSFDDFSRKLSLVMHQLCIIGVMIFMPLSVSSLLLFSYAAVCILEQAMILDGEMLDYAKFNDILAFANSLFANTIQTGMGAVFIAQVLGIGLGSPYFFLLLSSGLYAGHLAANHFTRINQRLTMPMSIKAFLDHGLVRLFISSCTAILFSFFAWHCAQSCAVTLGLNSIIGDYFAVLGSILTLPAVFALTLRVVEESAWDKHPIFSGKLRKQGLWLLAGLVSSILLYTVFAHTQSTMALWIALFNVKGVSLTVWPIWMNLGLTVMSMLCIGYTITPFMQIKTLPEKIVESIIRLCIISVAIFLWSPMLAQISASITLPILGYAWPGYTFAIIPVVMVCSMFHNGLNVYKKWFRLDDNTNIPEMQTENIPSNAFKHSSPSSTTGNNQQVNIDLHSKETNYGT